MKTIWNEHDEREHDARFVLWQEIQGGEGSVLAGGQLETELELEFGAFTRDPEADDREMEDGFTHPDDDEPSLVAGVTAGELRQRSEDRTADSAPLAPGWTEAGPAEYRAAFSVLSAFFSLPLARKERPAPRLVTRIRAAELFKRFFGRQTYLGERIYS